MNREILIAKDIKKNYLSGDKILPILKGVDLTIEAGDIISLQGPSGVGKSTFLHILSGLDNQYEGDIEINGKKISLMTEKQKAKMRNKEIGFVFQFYNLLPEFSARENIAMPLLIHGIKKKKAMTKADEILERMGLIERATHKPSALSGGEQQRVAIGRALINNPAIIFCDEPTGNLDETSSLHIEEILFNLNKKEKKTIIIVTHNEHLAKKTNKHYYFKNGKLIE